MLSSATVAPTRSRPETPGDRVRKTRIRKSLTRQNLADLADVHVKTIANVEDGVTPERPTKRGYETVERIAAALNTTPEELGYQRRTRRVRIAGLTPEQRAVVEEILGLPSDDLAKVQEALRSIERRMK